MVVCLKFLSNGRDLLVSEGMPEGLKIDVKNGTWTFGEKEYEIGQCGEVKRISHFPVGVYDTTKFEHVQSLITDMQGVTREETAKL